MVRKHSRSFSEGDWSSKPVGKEGNSICGAMLLRNYLIINSILYSVIIKWMNHEAHPLYFWPLLLHSWVALLLLSTSMLLSHSSKLSLSQTQSKTKAKSSNPSPLSSNKTPKLSRLISALSLCKTKSLIRSCPSLLPLFCQTSSDTSSLSLKT